MSLAAPTLPERLLRTRPEPAGARVLRLAHGHLTLDELMCGAWAALGAGAPAACPVCDEAMIRRGEDEAARCRGCGTELS